MISAIQTFYWRVERFFEEVVTSIKYAFQRAFRGYDNSMWWGHNYQMAVVIVKTLKKLKENHNGHPMSMTNEEWGGILQTMIEGFEAFIAQDSLTADDKYWKDGVVSSETFLLDLHNEDWKKLEQKFRKGSRLYIKHFYDLWD